MPTPTKAQLTADQQAAVDVFFEFLVSDAPTFVLSGGAGVGKTFLMNYLSNDLMLTYERSCGIMGIDPVSYNIHFTATTNKAAEVLERSVNQPVQTIHSFLGLRVWDDYKSGKTKIETSHNTKTHRQIILFIDESSMISTELYEIILKHVVDSKIVFVGDKSQLSPIGEEISPVYLNVDPDYFVHLTQPVRNANTPALVDLCKQLRETVETNQFYRIRPNAPAIQFLNPDQMQDKMNEYFLKQNDSARILCYSNNRVNDYNEYIREIRGLPKEFVEGDQLVVATTYARGKLVLNVEREVYVHSVDPQIYKYGYQDVTPDGQEILYRNFGITPRASFMDPVEVPVTVRPAHVAATLKVLKKRKDWGRYFELKNFMADLRGKEACTVHKSQGSTYETVFVDLGNIGCCHDAEMVARMLFVAASRATSQVFFYGDLPYKYQGPDYHATTNSLAAE